MAELKVHARPCDIERMVQNEEVRQEFSRRLKTAVARAGHAEWGVGARLSEVTGATAKAASKWLNAESMPGRANMLAIAEWLGVRVEWLQYGEGEPHQPATPPESADQGRGIVPSAPTNSDSKQCDQKPGGRQVGQHLAAGRALFDRMTPRSRTLVARILEMEAQGALTDEDIQMLEKIVERFGTTR